MIPSSLLLAVFVGGGLTLVMGYLLSAVAANYADERTTRSGFEFGALKQVWTHREYAIAWGTGFLIVLFGMVTSMMINILPLISRTIKKVIQAVSDLQITVE